MKAAVCLSATTGEDTGSVLRLQAPDNKARAIRKSHFLPDRIPISGCLAGCAAEYAVMRPKKSLAGLDSLPALPWEVAIWDL
jgi:hypothetical protein